MRLEKYMEKHYAEKYAGNHNQIKKISKVYYALLILLVLSDFLIHKEHVTFLWDNIRGFNAFYGLLSTVLIIAVAKFVGHSWLMKKEDYYD